MLKYNKFQIRNATLDDLPQLLELENEWPEHVRAPKEELARRMQKFAAGYFIAIDHSGTIASIISHPYHYRNSDLSNYRTWEHIVHECYSQDLTVNETNALYIVSGTTKKTPYVTELFNAGIHLVIDLAKLMNKRYVIAGALLPGFARFKQAYAQASVSDYVFRKSQGRYIDPLLEKYRRIGFHVPDENHIVENYFPDDSSLGYSALVVKDLHCSGS